MLNADVWADLERYAAAGSRRLDAEAATLDALSLPAKAPLGANILLRWRTRSCAFVVLSVPGIAPVQLPPSGEYRLHVATLGRWRIALALWSEDDNDAGQAGRIEERWIDVVARPVRLHSTRTHIEAQIGSVQRVSWSVEGAVSVFLRHGADRMVVPYSGSVDLTMPALEDEISLCALGDDETEHRQYWTLVPVLSIADQEFPEFASSVRCWTWLSPRSNRWNCRACLTSSYSDSGNPGRHTRLRRSAF